MKKTTLHKTLLISTGFIAAFLFISVEQKDVYSVSLEEGGKATFSHEFSMDTLQKNKKIVYDNRIPEEKFPTVKVGELIKLSVIDDDINRIEVKFSSVKLDHIKTLKVGDTTLNLPALKNINSVSNHQFSEQLKCASSTINSATLNVCQETKWNLNF